MSYNNPKQHYVPQFYLRYFSPKYVENKLRNKNKNDPIWVYDKNNLKDNIYSQKIKNVAQTKMGYTAFDEYNNKTVNLEPFFSKKEKIVSKNINNMLVDLYEKKPLTNEIEYKKAINLFIVLQHFRAKKNEELWTIIYQGNFKSLLVKGILDFYFDYPHFFSFKYDDLKDSSLFKKSFPNEIHKSQKEIEYNIELFLFPELFIINKWNLSKQILFYYYFYTNSHLELKNQSKVSRLCEIKRIITKHEESLRFRKMILIINNTEIPFITSDEPVLIIENKTNNIKNGGLLSQDTEIYIPLTQKYMAYLYELHPDFDEKKFDQLKKHTGFLHDHLNLKEIENNSEGKKLVEDINKFEFQAGFRYIFSSDKNIFPYDL